ncbi:MAG: energy transducer TonB [Gemmatimonadetes bacterium]|nr:energy transducer TonB [Gemmatimonadota bacterium]
MRYNGLLLIISPLLLSCGADDGGARDANEPRRGFEPPVVTNPEAPVIYPEDLYEDQVEGLVLLHLFVNEDGTIVPDSTRVEESSGFPQLDSAALQSVDLLRFAPARRDGVPVATAFVQPVHFRHPDLAARAENQ